MAWCHTWGSHPRRMDGRSEPSLETLKGGRLVGQNWVCYLSKDLFASKMFQKSGGIWYMLCYVVICCIFSSKDLTSGSMSNILLKMFLFPTSNGLVDMIFDGLKWFKSNSSWTAADRTPLVGGGKPCEKVPVPVVERRYNLLLAFQKHLYMVDATFRVGQSLRTCWLYRTCLTLCGWGGWEGNLVFWSVFFHLKHVIISSVAFPIVVLKRGHNSQGCGIIATSAWLADNNLAAGGRTNIRGVAGSQLLTYLNWVPWACFHAKSVSCFDCRLEILEIVHHLQILEVVRWHTKHEFVRVWYLQMLSCAARRTCRWLLINWGRIHFL